MDLENIKDAKAFTARCPKMDKIRISVYLVYRGSFNDERLIESREFSVEELKNKPLLWIDLYLGRKADNRIKIAFARLSGRSLYYLLDNGEDVTAAKMGEYGSCFAEDYDERYIISSKIW